MWRTVKLYLGLGNKSDYGAGDTIEDGSRPAFVMPLWVIAVGTFLGTLLVVRVLSDANVFVQVAVIIAITLAAEGLYVLIGRLRAGPPAR